MSIQIDIQKKLGNFSLQVQFQSKSKRIGILGASGCGKSVTLRSIAGIELPQAGYICVDRELFFDSSKKINLKPQKRSVGYLFQNYALFPTMTVEQNIAAGLKIRKIDRRMKVQEMMQRFQLEELARHLPGELSGGQQQRVALARIIAYEPKVILLDEPYSALDVFLRDQMQQELAELLKDYSGTVIMVSHNRDEIYRFSEELVIIDRGKTVINGRTKELFVNPKYKIAASLTGCKNLVTVIRIDSHNLKIPDWGIDIYTKKEISEKVKYIGIRAHDFKPAWSRVNDNNCVQVQLSSTAELPFERQYYLTPVKAVNSIEVQKNNLICWYVQRDELEEINKKGVPDFLEIPEDKLLFLE